MEFTRPVVEAVEQFRRACRAAGMREAHASFVDHEDPEDAEFDGWTMTGRDVLGRFHYANESQGNLGAAS